MRKLLVDCECFRIVNPLAFFLRINLSDLILFQALLIIWADSQKNQMLYKITMKYRLAEESKKVAWKCLIMKVKIFEKNARNFKQDIMNCE